MAIRKIPAVPPAGLAGSGNAEDGRPAARDGNELAACIDATYRAVMRVLDGDGPDADHKAIARLSAHLAAMRRTVYPAARRQPDAMHQLLAGYRDSARELDWALRLVQGQLTGHVFAAQLDEDVVYPRLQHYLSSYAAAEGRLIRGLSQQLGASDLAQLAVTYRKSLAHAPTRPHPRRPHTGLAYRARFTLHGFWDRLLDTADARPGTGRDFPQPLPPPARPTLIPPRRLLPGPR